MTKLINSALLFATLISLATATTYTTVVTTTTTDDAENPRGQSCQQQMQPQMINQCRMWIAKEQGGYANEEPFLRSEVANPMEQVLKQCCEQLKNIKSECRCEAIRSMVSEMPLQQYGAKMQEMLGVASSLPGRFCGMKSPSYCQMRQMYY